MPSVAVLLGRLSKLIATIAMGMVWMPEREGEVAGLTRPSPLYALLPTRIFKYMYNWLALAEAQREQVTPNTLPLPPTYYALCVVG